MTNTEKTKIPFGMVVNYFISKINYDIHGCSSLYKQNYKKN